MYSFDQITGGIIGVTQGVVSDFLINSQNFTQKLSSSQNLGFAVYLELEDIVKTFTVWGTPIFYEYSGNYYIQIWLQKNGPFDYYKVSSISEPVVVTDSKFIKI